MIEDKAEELYCVNTAEAILFVNEVKITFYQEARELDEAQEKDIALGSSQKIPQNRKIVHLCQQLFITKM